jgi:hypothetical protein
MKRAILIVALFALAVAAQAQQACPCVPIEKKWVVEPCPNFDCAVSALVVGTGTRDLVTLPAASNDGRWVVLRRVASGAYIESPGNPFTLDSFDHVSEASERFKAIDSGHAPMILSAPDGKMLVISLKEPAIRRRAAAR